jgi:hypothetical protein
MVSRHCRQNGGSEKPLNDGHTHSDINSEAVEAQVSQRAQAADHHSVRLCEYERQNGNDIHTH